MARRSPIKTLATLATEPSAIDRLVKCGDELAERSPDDIRLAMQSALGSAMFCNANESEVHTGYSKNVEDLLVAEFANKVEYKDNDLAEFYDRCSVFVTGSGKGESLERAKRKIDVLIFGRPTQVEVILIEPKQNI